MNEIMRIYGSQESPFAPFSGNCRGFRGAIATEHYLSAQTGMDILKAGGNAFDAAAAATLVESVVNPHMFSLGGECPMLLYSVSDRQVVAINGNTEAPALATLEFYRARGFAEVPPEGVFAAGAPAVLSALLEMVRRYGSLPFEVLAEPAFQLARDGFPAHEGLLYMPGFSIQANREKFLDLWPASATAYLTGEKAVPAPGDKMINAPLAEVFNTLMTESRRRGVDRQAGLRAVLDCFYRGDIAAEIVRFVEGQGGLLSREDLARFHTRVEAPVSMDFRDTTLFKCGPWSQGPVFLQLLRLLDGFELQRLGHNSADMLHLWIEAAKLAYADREQFYADPNFVDVPLEELLSESYNAQRRRLIAADRASGEHRPGDPRRGGALLPPEQIFFAGNWGYGTVHVAVADGHGNLAALTPSGGWIAGNEIMPALGFALPSRLQTFHLDPDHPNVLAPGKQPRTTLSPTLAFRHGRPWMVFGTSGGDQQDQWTSQFYLNRVVFSMSLQEAIEAPKITCLHMPGSFYPHDAMPGRIKVEGRIPARTSEALRQRGHRVEQLADWVSGHICAVSRNEAGLLTAGADPRGHKAVVFPSCALAW